MTLCTSCKHNDVCIVTNMDAIRGGCIYYTPKTKTTNADRPALGWISVEERLPETNGRYIVAYEDATSVLDFFNGKWFFPWHSSPGCIAWEEEGTIQAWMPFPELPEVSK